MESGCYQRFMLKVFLVNFCFGLVSSLYFHMAEGERKCVIEEIPADTVIVGDYWTRLYDEQKHEYLPATRNLTLSVAARTPTDKLIMSHKETKGRFNFTSFTSGEHKICLQPSLSQPLTVGFIVVVHIDIRSGERTNNYTEIHKRELLTELQLRVRRLSAQAHDIHKELISSKSRYENFLAINHNINMWIYWWPIIRCIFVVTFIMSITNSY